MTDSLAEFVYPIVELGLDLKADLQRGMRLSFDREHARVKELLLSPGPDMPADRNVANRGQVLSRSESRSREEQYLGIRYPLACWLDELFTSEPLWADRWNEQKLEVELYGSNDRAWKFWEQAKLAEQLPADDPLEIFFLCVTLGFRGTLGEDDERLEEWYRASRMRLNKPPKKTTPFDLEPDPDPNVPPRHGERLYAQMLGTLSVAMLLVIPIVGFVLTMRAGWR